MTFLEEIYTPDPWMLDGACADIDNPDIFFDTQPALIKEALALCKSCPVRLMCAEYAINGNIEEGIFGGLTPADRKQIRGLKARSRKGIPNKKH